MHGAHHRPPIPRHGRRYNRWLLLASKRVEYLRQKEREAVRTHAIAQEKEAYRRHGASLQQAAWEQRGKAADAERALVERKQATTAALKQQAAVRQSDAAQRERMYQGYVRAVHDEVVEAQEDVRLAKAAVTQHNAAVGSTIRAVTGALEQKRTQLQAAKEEEARKARDRVRQSGIVMVSPEIAARIQQSSQGYGRRGPIAKEVHA